MRIPAFPGSAPLTLAHLDDFYRAFQASPPEISEFTFTNLYCWRTVYGFTVSSLKGMILLQSRQGEHASFFDPIGKGDTFAVIREAAAAFPALPWVRVPGSTAMLFEGVKGFTVSPDEANADYLYHTSDLVSLEGRKYDGKRNLIKNFRSKHTYEYSVLDESHAAECLAFQEDWCAMKDCKNDLGLSNEQDAVREMISHCHHFHLIAGGIRVEGKISAVAIAEALNPQTLVMHVLKADPRIPGLYQTMLNEFLARQAGHFPFTNLEQDLGIEGLRKAKRSYHPLRLVSKYTLRPVPHA